MAKMLTGEHKGFFDSVFSYSVAAGMGAVGFLVENGNAIMILLGIAIGCVRLFTDIVVAKHTISKKK